MFDSFAKKHRMATCYFVNHSRENQMVDCVDCGVNNRNNNKYCTSCGTPLFYFCLKCGFPAAEGDKFCGGCGVRASAPNGNIRPLPASEIADRQQTTPASAPPNQSSPSMEGERKNVTVLFADISGFTAMSELLDPEEVTNIMNGCMKFLANSVIKFEGYVDKFIGDCVMAIFGAPVTHENDPELAIRSALDMMKEMEEYNKGIQVKLEKPLSLHIGLNSGTVIAGGIGSDQKMEYTVMGDTVNLASRLESNACNGQIFISGYTYNLTRNLFEFICHDPMKVKGKKNPVAVYEVVKEKSYQAQGAKSLETTSPMIGRVPEMETLNSCLEKLIDGMGQAIFMISEAGLGKSRVLFEVKNYVKKEEFQNIEGICRSFNSSTSYYVFSELFKDLFNVDVDDLPESVAEKIAQNLPLLLGLDPETLTQESREAIVFIASIMGINLGEDYDIPLGQMEAQEVKSATFRSITWFFEQLAKKKPSVLILEDLHYADNTSVEIIACLFERLKHIPLMLLLLFRPQKDHPSSKLPIIAERSLDDRSTQIIFHQLTPKECDQMVQSLLNTNNVPDVLLDEIRKRAVGNPLFIEEIVRNLIEEGIVTKADDGSINIAKKLDKVTIPDSIQGMVIARVDKLQGRLKEVLHTASVIGTVFEYDLLSRVLKKNDLDDIINQLVELELVFEAKSFPNIEYSFRNILIREAVYSCLLLQKRKELHAIVAKEIESLHENYLDGYYEVLAQHYINAVDLPRAFDYLYKSGLKAKQAYANQDAVNYFNQAIDTARELNSASLPLADVFTSLSEVLELQGKLDDAIRSRFKAIDLIKDDLKKGDAMRNIGRLHEKQGSKEVAMEVYDKAYETLKDYPDSVEMGVLTTNQSWVYNRMRKFDQAIEKGFLALKILEAHNTPENIAQVYNNLAVIFEHKGDFDQAHEYHQKSLKIYSKLGNKRRTANVYLSQGYLENKRDNLELALDYFSRSLDIMDVIGNRYGAATALMSKGRCFIDLGRLEESESALLQSLRIHKELDLKKKMVANELALGKVYIEKGESKSAREHLDSAMQAASANGYASDLAKAVRLEARLMIKEGKSPEKKFEEAIKLFKDDGRDREAASVAKELEGYSKSA